jgi:hypothetical protein
MHSFDIAIVNGSYVYTFICQDESSTTSSLFLYATYKHTISFLYFWYIQLMIAIFCSRNM